MIVSEVWRAALSIIADLSPQTYWRMSNGAEFWWTLTSRAQLLDDRFAEEAYYYAEIVSVSVFNDVRYGHKLLSCDWPTLRQRLLSIEGLQVEELCDVTIQNASPPNQVLRLTAAS